MDGLLGLALSTISAVLIAGIAWGDSKRQQNNTAARVVAIETEQAAMRDRAIRDNQRIESVTDDVETLQEEMKQVRENWVTRDHLEKALDKQLDRIVNAVAERRGQSRSQPQ